MAQRFSKLYKNPRQKLAKNLIQKAGGQQAFAKKAYGSNYQQGDLKAALRTARQRGGAPDAQRKTLLGQRRKALVSLTPRRQKLRSLVAEQKPGGNSAQYSKLKKFQGWMNKNPAYGRKQDRWERTQSLKPGIGISTPAPKPTIQFSPEQTAYMEKERLAGNPNFGIDPATGKPFVGQVLAPSVGGPLRRRPSGSGSRNAGRSLGGRPQ